MQNIHIYAFTEIIMLKRQMTQNTESIPVIRPTIAVVVAVVVGFFSLERNSRLQLIRMKSDTQSIDVI